MIRLIKKYGTLYLLLMLIVVFIVIIFIFRRFFNCNVGASQAVFTGFLVFITAYYAWQTKRTVREISRQTDTQREKDLRPVILRSGIIDSWQKVKFNWNGSELVEGNPLEFTIAKNIATDISGYIVIDGSKYRLLFYNDISKVGENAYSFLEKWGWMKPDSKLFAVYKEDNKEKTIESNRIYLYYKDIEGNKYFTVEDSSFSQKTFKSQK
ncbi:MAG: hypothetical protein PHW31_02625 [Candidatus Pacebacteria bacterium]|nr:hypothetical protein [Candidatus Paceibacterota bacterium]